MDIKWDYRRPFCFNRRHPGSLFSHLDEIPASPHDPPVGDLTMPTATNVLDVVLIYIYIYVCVYIYIYIFIYILCVNIKKYLNGFINQRVTGRWSSHK